MLQLTVEQAYTSLTEALKARIAEPEKLLYAVFCSLCTSAGSRQRCLLVCLPQRQCLHHRLFARGHSTALQAHKRAFCVLVGTDVVLQGWHIRVLWEFHLLVSKVHLLNLIGNVKDAAVSGRCWTLAMLPFVDMFPSKLEKKSDFPRPGPVQAEPQL